MWAKSVVDVERFRDGGPPELWALSFRRSAVSPRLTSTDPSLALRASGGAVTTLQTYFGSREDVLTRAGGMRQT